jgi:fructokinase
MRVANVRIGIDLGGTKIAGVALDDAGVEIARVRVATPRDDYAGTIAAIADMVAMLERTAGPAHSVGVGTPGSRSRATGLMKNCNSTWLNGRPMSVDLADALGRAVSIANDADCFALSEATDGAARAAEVVFGVILGTGVGGGVVVAGRPLSGPNGIAGEWGHTPLPWPNDAERPGPACYCGRSGCVETFLSGPALAADHLRVAGASLEAAEIEALALRGDAQARASLDRYVDRLSRGLAVVIDVLDPDVIVLGGGLSNLELLYTEVPAAWGRWVFSDRVDTRLVRATHGAASGVRGAARL